MDHEIEVMYEMMNDTGRSHLKGMARQLARSFPSVGGKSLRPVDKADDVHLLDNVPNCAIYQFPLVGAREPINRKKADLC